MKYKYRSFGHSEVTREFKNFQNAYSEITGCRIEGFLDVLDTQQARNYTYPVLRDSEANYGWQLWIYQAEQKHFETQCAMFEQQCFGMHTAQNYGWDAPAGVFKTLAQVAGLTFDEWEYIKAYIGVDYLSDAAQAEIEEYVNEGSDPAWVSVKSWLPQAGQEVLVYRSSSGLELLAVDEGGLPEDITHWMYLPKAP